MFIVKVGKTKQSIIPGSAGYGAKSEPTLVYIPIPALFQKAVACENNKKAVGNRGASWLKSGAAVTRAICDINKLISALGDRKKHGLYYSDLGGWSRRGRGG